MKKRLIFALCIGLLAAGFYWVSAHSYIEIAADPATNGNTALYQLLNQATQKTVELKNPGTKVKRIVKKGSYELLAKQGETSYFSVIKTGGFLGTTSVQAKLTPEKDRQFVGNNPEPCTQYVYQTLLSFNCGGFFNNVQIHVPATSSRPTYTQKVSSPVQGTVEGFATTQEGTVALIQLAPSDQPRTALHMVYLMDSSFRLSGGVALSDLDNARPYTVGTYRDGFIVYDSSSYERILYYAATIAKPETVTLNKPADKQLRPYALSIQDNSVAVAYSNNTKGQLTSLDGPAGRKVKTQIIVNDKGTSRSFSFKGQYAYVRLCGNTKLCVVNGKQLEVYDISGSKQKLLFRVSGVDAIENSKSGLLAIRQKEVLGLDVDTHQGSIQYSLGSYDSCGSMQVDDSGYSLCLVNSKHKKVALRISQDSTNSDTVDKKVAELLKLPEVADVSMYGSFIYISPNLGQLVYNTTTKSFDYDPGTKKRVGDKLNQEVSRLGIDRSKYKVINPFQ